MGRLVTSANAPTSSFTSDWCTAHPLRLILVIVDAMIRQSCPAATLEGHTEHRVRTDEGNDQSRDDVIGRSIKVEAPTKPNGIVRETASATPSFAPPSIDKVAHADEEAEGGEGDDDEETDSDSSGWSSSSEEEDTEPEEMIEEIADEKDEAARATERLKVLAAAGVLVQGERRNAPAPPGAKAAEQLMRRSTKRRPNGPRPEAPVRRRPTRRSTKPERDLPVPPEAEPEGRTEDAYDRFMKLQNEMTASKALVSPPGSPRPSTGQRTPSMMSMPSADSAIPTTPSRTSTPKVGSASVDSPTPAPPEHSKTSGLLHSLASSWRSHRVASAAGEKKLAPIISGPISGPGPMEKISSGQDGAVTPSTSNSLSLPSAASSGASAMANTPSQSSWSSFMDSQALSSIPDRERKRQEAIFELCQTESSHVRDLQTIVEVFYNSILEAESAGNGPLLDDKARMVIFANIEDIMLTAVSFLSDLEELQRASRLYVDEIGGLLLQHIPSMKVYLPYCTNQATAASILASERSKNADLEQLLLRLRSNGGRGLDLASYLLTPMQRLTRYPLLLGQILRYTAEDHTDYGRVQKAMKEAEKILGNTNERIREEESRTRLSVLSKTLYVGDQARLDLTKPTLFGPRRILKEEVLLKHKSKSQRKLTLILCNDLILILSGPNLYRMPAPLEEVVVRRLPGGKARAGIEAATGTTSGPTGSSSEQAFQLLFSGASEKVNLRCHSVRSAHLWMRSIEEARSEYFSNVQNVRRSGNGTGSGGGGGGGEGRRHSRTSSALGSAAVVEGQPTLADPTRGGSPALISAHRTGMKMF